MSTRRYPKLAIRTKHELAKRISGKQLSYSLALELIKDARTKFNEYWYDSKESKPGKNKFVRSAVGNSLGRLLALIDKKVLAPHDSLVPDFLFGGLSGKSHIQAAYHLLGQKRQRTILALDISSFFERIKKQRIFYFFYKKCECTVDVANLLADLCCVPSGPKGKGSSDIVLARGFATSPRLALWSNLDVFLRLKWKTYKKLRGHDPRIAIFVDDIGITASRISKDRMKELSNVAQSLLNNFDKNQPLPINPEKEKIKSYEEGMEHLGLRLGRNRLSLGGKTKAKKDKLYKQLEKSLPKSTRARLNKRKGSYKNYEKQVENVSQTKLKI